MHKIILASAAAVLMTAGAADAQMLLHQGANGNKVVVNQWAGQSYDPISRQVIHGPARPPAAARHALPVPRSAFPAARSGTERRALAIPRGDFRLPARTTGRGDTWGD